jgi:hypothetical protein
MRKAQRAVIVAALTLLLLACGSPPGSAHRGEVVITEQEQFHTVPVPAGALVEVRLRALPGFNPWSRPVSSDTAVLDPVAAAKQPRSTDQVTIVDFFARKAGTARLESGASVHCGPAQICPMLIRAWIVSVHVE